MSWRYDNWGHIPVRNSLDDSLIRNAKINDHVNIQTFIQCDGLLHCTRKSIKQERLAIFDGLHCIPHNHSNHDVVRDEASLYVIVVNMMRAPVSTSIEHVRRTRFLLSTNSPSINFFASNPSGVWFLTCCLNSSPVETCRNCGKSARILPEMVPLPPPGLPRMRRECAQCWCAVLLWLWWESSSCNSCALYSRVARLRHRTVVGTPRRLRNEAPISRAVGLISRIILFVCWCHDWRGSERNSCILGWLDVRRPATADRIDVKVESRRSQFNMNEFILFMAKLFQLGTRPYHSMVCTIRCFVAYLKYMEMQRSKNWCLKV